MTQKKDEKIRAKDYGHYVKYLLLFLIPLQCQAIESDKAAHIAIAYSATVSGVYILKKHLKIPSPYAQLATGFLVMSAGLIKESQDTSPDFGDIKANGVGVALGAAFTWVF